MLHEIEFEKSGKRYKATSTLILNGENDAQTAMAKTVGLPLGIAARLLLNGTIKEKGLLIPINEEIYNPVLDQLEQYGIVFKEAVHVLD